jgi:hypothetical protein
VTTASCVRLRLDHQIWDVDHGRRSILQQALQRPRVAFDRRINQLCCPWIAWRGKHPHAGEFDDLVDIGRTQEDCISRRDRFRSGVLCEPKPLPIVKAEINCACRAGQDELDVIHLLRTWNPRPLFAITVQSSSIFIVAHPHLALEPRRGSTPVTDPAEAGVALVETVPVEDDARNQLGTQSQRCGLPRADVIDMQ